MTTGAASSPRHKSRFGTVLFQVLDTLTIVAGCGRFYQNTVERIAPGQKVCLEVGHESGPDIGVFDLLYHTEQLVVELAPRVASDDLRDGGTGQAVAAQTDDVEMDASVEESRLGRACSWSSPAIWDGYGASSDRHAASPAPHGRTPQAGNSLEERRGRILKGFRQMALHQVNWWWIRARLQPMEHGDSELLLRWREGDLTAGEALFERYYALIERFFLNKLQAGVGDLVQETFVACVENRDRLKQTTRFRSYLFSIAHNILYRHLRNRYRHGVDCDFEQVSVRDLAPGPSSVVVRRTEQRLLLEALRSIPVAQQVILELHYWEGMKTTEISEILDLPPGTVRSRLQRARARLEDVMGELEKSPELLESTRSHLDDWARQCRQAVIAQSAG